MGEREGNKSRLVIRGDKRYPERKHKRYGNETEPAVIARGVHVPFQPPNMIIFDSAATTVVWPHRAAGRMPDTTGCLRRERFRHTHAQLSMICAA